MYIIYSDCLNSQTFYCLVFQDLTVYSCFSQGSTKVLGKVFARVLQYHPDKTSKYSVHVYVVVQLLFILGSIFYCLFFYTHCHTLPYTKTKENRN